MSAFCGAVAHGNVMVRVVWVDRLMRCIVVMSDICQYGVAVWHARNSLLSRVARHTTSNAPCRSSWLGVDLSIDIVKQFSEQGTISARDPHRACAVAAGVPPANRGCLVSGRVLLAGSRALRMSTVRRHARASVGTVSVLEMQECSPPLIRRGSASGRAREGMRGTGPGWAEADTCRPEDVRGGRTPPASGCLAAGSSV